ncbi:MAG: sigma-70 family RNA polymerase sigma factor [Desulfobacteraceae bacterium]|nr:sigma-70 family RNA polymerase sigma factor [Desulfobacteraceae bacterium]
MKKSNSDGLQLLKKLFSGSKTAGELFVRAYSGLVYKSIQYTLLARNVSFSKDDLEDLHNTVFLRLFENDYRKLRQYQGKNGCSIPSWIRMIAVRIVLDHLRLKNIDSLSSRKAQISLEDLPEIKVNGNTPLARLESNEQLKILKKAMASLPDRDRMFLNLHIGKSLSIAEAAGIMHLTVDNAYTVKHRAIQKLKTYVEDRHDI